jgi:methylthioribose-1-phosphate isomerase
MINPEVENPAFDIIPKDLITGIITEEGILEPI